MQEDEVKTEPESGGEVTETEQQPSAEPVVKKTKAAADATSQSTAPAKKAEKAKKPAVIDEIMATIKNMTVLELAGLVRAIETEFGVTAAPPVSAASANASGADLFRLEGI